ncbi:MAG: hypothetical protein IKR86_07445, partial [Candidatus Methanomethylophilaceae archaeon]|nr:hypothetical protein [Candidatus Methanomethylophilaceae archaeon]
MSALSSNTIPGTSECLDLKLENWPSVTLQVSGRSSLAPFSVSALSALTRSGETSPISPWKSLNQLLLTTVMLSFTLMPRSWAHLAASL